MCLYQSAQKHQLLGGMGSKYPWYPPTEKARVEYNIYCSLHPGVSSVASLTRSPRSPIIVIKQTKPKQTTDTLLGPHSCSRLTNPFRPQLGIKTTSGVREWFFLCRSGQPRPTIDPGQPWAKLVGFCCLPYWLLLSLCRLYIYIYIYRPLLVRIPNSKHTAG